MLFFDTKHPQYTTHALRRRKVRHIPVLCGWPIPRRDLPDQADKYAVTILSLFRPWSRSGHAPLKPEDVSWSDALAELLSKLPPHHWEIINHMQEQWECKLAADDFSALRQKRHAEARETNGFLSSDDLGDALANDIDWQLGQGAIGPDYDDATPDADDIGSELFVEKCTAAQAASAAVTISLADAAGFYKIPSPPKNIVLPGQSLEGDSADKVTARDAARLLQEEKAAVLRSRAGFTLLLFHL